MRGSTITLEDYPLEQAMDLFRAAGFDSLEMWKHHLKKCKSSLLRRKFAAYAKSIGISMGGYNAVGEDYYRPFGSDAEVDSTLQGLQNDAEAALALGTRDLLIWEGVAPKGMSESECRARLLPRLIEVLSTAIRFTKPRGMRILVEPHPFTLGMSDRFLQELCDALDPDYFGVTFDFCHYGVGRAKDYLEAIPTLGHRIRHIHFSDTDQQTSELHFPPGAGRLQLQSMLEAFKDIGYTGTMALDLYGYPMPVRELPHCAARTRDAMEFLGIET